MVEENIFLPERTLKHKELEKYYLDMINNVTPTQQWMLPIVFIKYIATRHSFLYCDEDDYCKTIFNILDKRYLPYLPTELSP